MKNKKLRLIYHAVGMFSICVIISWLFSREGNGQNFELGFPFTFYEQFKLRGNNYVNFSWDIYNFVLDAFIIFICTFMITIVVSWLSENRK